MPITSLYRGNHYLGHPRTAAPAIEIASVRNEAIFKVEDQLVKRKHTAIGVPIATATKTARAVRIAEDFMVEETASALGEPGAWIPSLICVGTSFSRMLEMLVR